jgi:hypothetical protein
LVSKRINAKIAELAAFKPHNRHLYHPQGQIRDFNTSPNTAATDFRL